MEAEARDAEGERKAGSPMASAATEAEIEKAMLARVDDFRKQADSLTLEGVRRALEKDMGLEKHSLDAHKKFIKQCVDKVFYGSDDENTTNTSEKVEDKDDKSAIGSEDAQPTSVLNKSSSSADEQAVEKDLEGEKDQGSGSDISEDMIKEAIDRRASYFRKNSETLTLLGVRRTLEEDLKLEKKALDAYKRFITTELDNVLQQPANGDKKQKTSKGPKRARQDSDTSEINDSCSDREDSGEDTRPKKRGAEKAKAIKRQKKATEEKKQSAPKAKKTSKPDVDKISEEGVENSSEEDHSVEDNKKKRQPAPAYGKQVEHLKSIIKLCGMSVPPSVYRRAKQAPESKREAWLLKELEEILEKEGLSKNPSEKEIKAVKKRKERAKELEGIDMSNIISSSRRRTASSYIPPPKPKVEAESDEDDDDNEDDGDDNGDEDDEMNGEDEDAGDNDDAEANDRSGDDAEDESD